MQQNGQHSYTCFFYGTLMNVDILCRVIGTSHDHLEFADAVLKNHTRHHVKGVDYPAVVPAEQGRKVIGRELTEDEANVRGTVVRGLTTSDVQFLDTFEGDEYFRDSVMVDLLSPMRAASDTSSPTEEASSGTISANVYIWTAGSHMLSPKLWSYAQFLRDKSHLWVGTAKNEQEYAEVDRRRRMEGKIVHEHKEVLPKFGHAVRDAEFDLAPGYVNLNHGGMGALPKRVAASRRRWQDLAEKRPDQFFRRDYYEHVEDVKRRAGDFLGCPGSELAFVLNATTGVNIVLRSLRWQKGDCILYFPNAVYSACFNTLQYVVDRNPDLHIRLVPVPFTLPQSHASILSQTQSVIEETRASLAPGERIRLGLIDAIVAKPGVVLPWQELCALYKKYDILSVIDAAHWMGQMPVCLRRTDVDFWVSNAHKWCFAARSLALLYVPKRNHHLIETFPTSFGYVSSREPKSADSTSSFEQDFSYTGTQDVSSVLSLVDAFDFRLYCGGEERIHGYIHDLARKGAQRIADILGTEVMQNEEGSLIAAIANVRVDLPCEVVPADLNKVADKIGWLLMDEHDCFAQMFGYDDKLWVRVSAQVYNELGDFEYLARALLEVLHNRADAWVS